MNRSYGHFALGAPIPAGYTAAVKLQGGTNPRTHTSMYFRDVAGSGGYRYRQWQNGDITILPSGKTVTASSSAGRAITAEIGSFTQTSTSAPVSSYRATPDPGSLWSYIQAGVPQPKGKAPASPLVSSDASLPGEGAGAMTAFEKYKMPIVGGGIAVTLLVVLLVVAGRR